MKMIIDTDPGIDDAMAIFYAALDPEIELLGLTTVFGNITVKTATRNALRLVEMAGLDIPVAQGASKPLALPSFPPSTEVHGKEGFGNIPAQSPKGRASDEPATALLSQMAREHRGEMVVCAIGPITNIAETIRYDPEFADNVRKIVFMGGAAFVPGNRSEYAEANTYHDPHALNVVMHSGDDITMVGLDVTLKILCRDDDFAEIEKRSPRLGGFLREASRYYLDFYLNKAGRAGCGLHDPAAVIACTNPELFRRNRSPVRVIEDGEMAGKTMPEINGPSRRIQICVGGDLARVKDRFISMFGALA